MSLAARYLEERGIATVVASSARDITEHCGAPRVLFTNHPLGNPIGSPWDRATQRENTQRALSLLESAVSPGETVLSPTEWQGKASWQQAYMSLDGEDPEELLERGRARRRLRDEANGRTR